VRLKDRPIRLLRAERVRRVGAVIAIACHSGRAAQGPSRTGCGATRRGSNSEAWLVNSIF
jgi:hypothetical protein